MKKYIIILCMISMTASISCKKALNEELHSALSPDNFYKTPQDAESALNGAFSALKSQTYYQRTIYLITDLSADIFRPNNADNDRQELYRASYTPFNDQLYAFWSNAYITIKNSNDVITYVPDMEIDESFKNNILGNAYFLRGMAHFDLVRMFGDVPVILKNSGEQDLFPSRSPAKDVYAQIIQDLLFAEQNCVHADAISSDKIGRVSSEAASAMLARVYLQRSSTSFGDPSDSQNALDECNKLINYSQSHPSVIGMVSDYRDIFDVTKKNGPESIFAVQFGSGTPDNVNITNLMFDPESIGGYAAFLPEASFYGSYDPDDSRKAVNVGTIDAGNTFISKYHDPTVAPGGFGGTNWIVLRYSDVLLMQSEAMNSLNPGDINKFNGINQIRTRAGLGDKLLNFVNTPSSDDFINALVNERLWELPLEGVRRWDLIRLKKFLPVKAAQGFTITEDRILMPIPQSERDVNKNLTQNPGY